jgi:hypothetical protein
MQERALRRWSCFRLYSPPRAGAPGRLWRERRRLPAPGMLQPCDEVVELPEPPLLDRFLHQQEPIARRIVLEARRAPRCHDGSADRRSVPNDPDVARPGLQPVKRPLEIARGRLRRPALADFADPARRFQLTQPPQRLRVIEPSRLGDPPGGMLAARKLAQHLLHAILVLLTRALACWGGRLGGGRSRFGRDCRNTPLPLRRSASVASTTRGTHHHRLGTVCPDHLQPAPMASGAANGATPSTAVDLRQILDAYRRHPPHDSGFTRRPTGAAPYWQSGQFPRRVTSWSVVWNPSRSDSWSIDRSRAGSLNATSLPHWSHTR